MIKIDGHTLQNKNKNKNWYKHTIDIIVKINTKWNLKYNTIVLQCLIFVKEKVLLLKIYNCKIYVINLWEQFKHLKMKKILVMVNYVTINFFSKWNYLNLKLVHV